MKLLTDCEESSLWRAVYAGCGGASTLKCTVSRKPRRIPITGIATCTKCGAQNIAELARVKNVAVVSPALQVIGLRTSLSWTEPMNIHYHLMNRKRSTQLAPTKTTIVPGYDHILSGMIDLLELTCSLH